VSLWRGHCFLILRFSPPFFFLSFSESGRTGPPFRKCPFCETKIRNFFLRALLLLFSFTPRETVARLLFPLPKTFSIRRRLAPFVGISLVPFLCRSISDYPFSRGVFFFFFSLARSRPRLPDGTVSLFLLRNCFSSPPPRKALKRCPLLYSFVTNRCGGPPPRARRLAPPQMPEALPSFPFLSKIPLSPPSTLTKKYRECFPRRRRSTSFFKFSSQYQTLLFSFLLKMHLQLVSLTSDTKPSPSNWKWGASPSLFLPFFDKWLFFLLFKTVRFSFSLLVSSRLFPRQKAVFRQLLTALPALFFPGRIASIPPLRQRSMWWRRAPTGWHAARLLFFSRARLQRTPFFSSSTSAPVWRN